MTSTARAGRKSKAGVQDPADDPCDQDHGGGRRGAPGQRGKLRGYG